MRRLYKNWVQLDGPDMTWVEKKITSVFWQYYNIKRHIKLAGSISGGVKKWWHLRKICKQVNKSLLKKVKEMENKALNKD